MALEKEVSGQIQKWTEPGIVVQGILQSHEHKMIQNKPSEVYEVKTKDGIVPFFAPALLHKSLQNVPIGHVVRIEYLKETKTGSGNTLKHFDVLRGAPTPEHMKSVGLESESSGLEKVNISDELDEDKDLKEF